MGSGGCFGNSTFIKSLHTAKSSHFLRTNDWNSALRCSLNFRRCSLGKISDQVEQHLRFLTISSEKIGARAFSAVLKEMGMQISDEMAQV